MAQDRWRIQGRVVDSESGRPLEGVRVEAWDKESLLEDVVGAAITQDDGSFCLHFDGHFFQQLFGDRRPELLLKAIADSGMELRGSAEVSTVQLDRAGASMVLPVAAPRQPASPRHVDTPPRREALQPLQVIDGRLTAVDGNDLSGFTVRVVGDDGFHDVVRDGGIFALRFPSSASRHQIEVVAPDGQVVRRLDIEPDHTAPVEIPLEIPRVSAPALDHLLGAPLPSELADALSARGLRSLADLRAASLSELPQSPALRKLESHAAMALLSGDLTRNGAVIDAGYAQPADIARSTRHKFVAKNQGTVGDLRAAKLQHSARSAVSYLDQVSVGLRASLANGYALAEGPATRLIEQAVRCQCSDCEAAVSPLAYLADLIDYTLAHVDDGGADITLAFLEATTHQPLARLPASCALMDTLVRQVRICVEVLRAHLQAHAPTAARRAVLAREEADYRLAAYSTILARLGTSYGDLRLARSDAPERRAALAERLGVLIGGPRPDALDQLHVDVETNPSPLTETFLEDRFGLVDTTRDPLAAGPTPKLLTWRRAATREQWRRQDFPHQGVGGGRPLIDPDVVGPDDFRVPRPKAAVGDPDGAFDLWLRRRTWVDAQLIVLSAMNQVVAGQLLPDLGAMLASQYVAVGYGAVNVTAWAATTPIADFATLRDNLTRGIAVAATRTRIETDLALSGDAFLRLTEVGAKHAAALADVRNEAVTAAEWSEVRSILAQARKMRLFAAWRAEEAAAHVTLTGRLFWAALREPPLGEWPPVATGRPWIDPDLVRREDLPEPSAGARARAFWDARRARLEQVTAALRTRREAAGLDAMLRDAVGHPNLGDPLPRPLDELRTDLASVDPAVVATARARVTSEFFTTLDEFMRLLAIAAKDAEADPRRKPTLDEWAELYEILARAQKAKRQYPIWLAEEQDLNTGVLYWQALKAALPLWRGSFEARAEWKTELEQRTQPALIDPDVIGPGEFARASGADPAFALFLARRALVSGRLTALRALRAGAPDARAGLAAVLTTAVGISRAELDAIAAERLAGNDVTGRLAQLGLEVDAFGYLLRLAKLVDAGAPVLDTEWADLLAIMVQVEKRRRYADWRDQEVAAALTLGPDHFRIAPIDLTVFPPPPPPELPAWRARLSDRIDWLDRLASRIEQDKGIADALAELVSASEETTLPQLRDALIRASNAPGNDVDGRAKWLADHLLIDTRAGGCQKTTRIAQAIEAMQGLLFGLRTRQLNDTYPNLDLDADHFDEEFDWIGSYATWRAAMFVHLYPDNLLLPSLRRWQTPAFRSLVGHLRSNRRLTPEDACNEARDYGDYYRDVCSLQVEATCEALTRIHSGTCRNRAAEGYSPILYMFGRGGATNRVYWSAWNRAEPEAYAQTFWEEVPGFKGIVNLIAALPFQISANERVLLLFARVVEKGKQKLMVARYDLETQTWSGEPNELEVPKDEGAESAAFTAVARQTTRGNVPPELTIRTPSGALYTRALNRDASDWADGEWAPVVPALRGGRFSELCAQVEIAPDEHYLIVREPEGWLQYRLFGPRDDGRWRYLAWGGFAGAFNWTGTSAAFVFAAKSPDVVMYRALVRADAPVDSELIRTVLQVEDWLYGVTGVSLSHLTISDGSLYSGMTLLQFLTLPRGDDPYLRTSPFPTQAFWNAVRDYFYRMRALIYIEYVAGQLDGKKEWKDWKFANDRIAEFASSDLRTVLTRVLDGISTTFRARNDGQEVGPLRGAASGLQRIPAAAWSAETGGTYFVEQRKDGVFRTSFLRVHGDSLTELSAKRVAPFVLEPFDLTEQLSESQLQLRRTLIENAFLDNASGPTSNLVYLEEAYYFVPVHLALQLQARGQFTSALDWFRTVYDYSVPSTARKIYYGLVREETLSTQFDRVDDWLLDPLNPHAIAATRALSYTRYTLLSIIRCFLDYADAEFTRDTAESVPRARVLYETALELLEEPELRRRSGLCDEILGTLDIEFGEPSWRIVWADTRAEIAEIQDPQRLREVVAAVRAVLDGQDPPEEKVQRAWALAKAARVNPPPVPTVGSLVSERPAHATQLHRALLATPEVASAVERVSAVSASELGRRVAQVTGRAEAALAEAELPWLRERRRHQPARKQRHSSGRSERAAVLKDAVAKAPLDAIEILRHPVITFVPAPSFHFCIPANPVLKALRMRAALNLYKLRNCRNIAGVVRELQPYAAPTDTVTGLPVIGSGGQLVLPGLSRLPPTPYRFSTLVERAKSLVSHAQQVESALLASIEKRDAEYYNVLNARNNVRAARAGVRLQDLRVREAEGGVRLAELQQERAQLQVDHYQDLLDRGVSGLETAALGLLGSAAALQLASAITSFVAAALPASVTIGFPPSTSFSPQGSVSAVAGGLNSIAAALSTTASIFSTLASYERRAEEWDFQKSLAQQDVKIGAQQVRIAEDHVRVVGQERVIAELLAESSETVVEFLANKFTNVDLYDWMSNVLEGVYGYFLQQATATAQLAANQLAFERQEVAPPVIQADYWEVGDEAGFGTDGARAPDRRGLTGSTRLLQDIVQLEQFAFDTNQRKLNLTKSISLARLAPAEFQRFRETGVMVFATPMELFDRDFPGHYLRLLRNVRTSVIALIPAVSGIRATLTASRLSRVVIGGDIFQTTPLERGPVQVALSAPRDATGVFEMDQQSDVKLPFEGIGVDTSWELRLPKASNLFDYDTIADVIITLEYTALNSFDYQQQVLQRLKPTLSSDRPFSFKYHLADQWFDLHNPERTATPMVVRFTTRREDFPPNLERLKIEHLVLHFSRDTGPAFEVPVRHLRFSEVGSGGAIGGAATSIDGTISTRRGNAGSWTGILGKAPLGTWELALQDDPDVRRLFKDERIKDILLVVTYRATLPPWPA